MVLAQGDPRGMGLAQGGPGDGSPRDEDEDKDAEEETAERAVGTAQSARQ
jgi:hypothetical protein